MAVSFEAILKILRDGGKTEFQKAADLHALIGGDDEPRVTTPAAPKAKRGRPARTVAVAVNGAEHETPAETLPGMNE